MAELKIPKGNGLFVTGVILVLLGVGSMISPAFAGNAVVYLIGGLLLITGLIELMAGWQVESWRQKLASLIHGGIAAVGWIAVMAHPFYGLAALALVLAIFFGVEGVWKVVSSFSYRPVRAVDGAAVDERRVERLDVRLRPSPTRAFDLHLLWRPDPHPRMFSHDVKNKSFKIAADVEIPAGGADGI